MAIISYLEYSNRDARYAHEMFKAECFDPCGRFCQQSIEKRFKHYINKNGTAEDMYILTTHSLVKLYTRVCELAGVSADKAVKGDLATLTDYYFDTNPKEDGNIELTKAMAAEAMEVATTVNKWVNLLLER